MAVSNQRWEQKYVSVMKKQTQKTMRINQFVTKFHSLLQTCETCCCPWNQAKKLKGKEKEQEHGEEEMAYPLTIFKCGKAIFEFWINLFIQLDLVIGLARIGCFCP
ncbi:hypothetical protein IC582_011643 [Cucumis melo]